MEDKNLNLKWLEEEKKNLEELKKEIQNLLMVDKETYEHFKSKISELEKKMNNFTDYDEGMKAEIIHDITDIRVDYDEYMDTGEKKWNAEERTFPPTMSISGSEKVIQHRLELYRDILQGLGKLDNIKLEDIEKLQAKWKEDCEKNDFGAIEKAMVEKELARVFLEYQIKYIQKEGKMPSEIVEKYCDVEKYQEVLREKIEEVIIKYREESKERGEESEEEKNKQDLKMRILEGKLLDWNFEEIVSDRQVWRTITGVENISREENDLKINEQEESLDKKEEEKNDEEKSKTTALVPVDYKKKSGTITFVYEKTLPNGEKVKKHIDRKIRKDGSVNMTFISKKIKDSITEIYLSEDITELPIAGKSMFSELSDFSFSDFGNLQSVYLSDGIKEIPGGTFLGCEKLTDIKLPKGLSEGTRNFTFLTQEQCFERDKLDVLKKRGTKAAITDFSVLLGGWVSSEHVENDSSLEGRTGYYWTKSDDGDNNARVVLRTGIRSFYFVDSRNGGARPALPFLSIGSIPTNGESGKRARDGILEVEYGYYPQKAVSRDMQERLERAYRNGSILKTKNSYTTDSVAYDEYDTSFQPQTHQEYEYNGKRYVRVEANSYFDGNDFTLSNGEQYRNGDNVWVEVLPVKWLVDEKSRIMITEKLIFAGVQFNKERNYRTRHFDMTDIKKFMDKYWSKDIEQIREENKRTKEQTEETEEKEDSYKKEAIKPDDIKSEELKDDMINRDKNEDDERI